MSLIQSFPPIVGKQAKILILGSMPGEASLAAKQYYAHPHNAFWPIITQWLEIPLETSYQEKIAALQASSIALWDVLKSCRRTGSLDSNIKADEQIINDFHTFFATYQKITQVIFNGSKAETCFKRNVSLVTNLHRLNLLRLPSTSPANARMSFEEKRHIWHKNLQVVRNRVPKC
ncbi:G/U mismatch-specific uracil-DNA glycosylase [Nitrosomonas sp. PY1]|uniref:DNA-deoxyinosine glycosylase n=1 Tax=Nitrosomonas sp. PY1 TaxID=1803906 RepID=UPI001FC83186|nr:DNA-deoxyinosine glycosylase [Nitrosomonas sp. PY1]GKS69997.1 G/U mismatch-specific uracil-DNA glycosylase [Nitrosomonas sp. PY1]